MRGSHIPIGWLLVLTTCTAVGQTVDIWLTTHDQQSKLEKQAPVLFASGGGGDNPVVLDTTTTYQEVEGFGASFTDSAAYLLNWEATPAARAEAMTNLFTRGGEGIGVSFVRNPMGASDLTRFHYSYDDAPPGGTDPSLDYFSIAHDETDIIPLLQEARQLNPELTIMGSPWSPPGWMKDSGSLIGGSLLASMRTSYANYFVKYIGAYEAEGLVIDYVSLQNEPLYVPDDYPGMGMSAVEQRDLLRDYMLPTFIASNISTKILIYDHNWDGSYYPEIVLGDPALQSSSLIAGTAWHGYSGTPGVMLALNNQYPAKGNYQTEHSGGLWVGGDANQIASDFKEIIHVMRNAGKAFVKWSLALDQHRGPNDGGCNSCSPLIFVDTDTGLVSYGIDYYTLGHFSKFIFPGARRIYSSNASGVVTAAFKNPNGSIVLVAFNDTSSRNTFQVEWGGTFFSYTLPKLSGATFTWSGPQAGNMVVDPKNQIQASSFEVMSGLMTEPAEDDRGGYSLGYTDHGDYSVYRNVRFTDDLTNVSVRVASFGGGAVEFRLDSPHGSLLASVAMPNTGGWQAWETTSAPVSSINGIHDLYVVFKGGGSIGNINWFRFEGDPVAGAVSQLIWTKQPASATNGFPFAQQPVLVTADAAGVPSVLGLPSTLDVAVAMTNGVGSLRGTTNVNIGTSGWNGIVHFGDLQIDSVVTNVQLTASATTVTNMISGNLLINSAFNSPNSIDPADDWTTWTTGGGWANHENHAGVSYDGSYYMVVGGGNGAAAGVSQTLPAVAGRAYLLSVMGGADSWWLPYGEMRFFFLNPEGAQIGASMRSTIDPANYGGEYDVPHPWEPFALTAIAPPETAELMVEFMSDGTGSIWYENAVLTESFNEAVVSTATTLPFSVHPYVLPSQPPVVAGITSLPGDGFVLEFVGTSGVYYFVESTTNLAPPLVWEAMPGSTVLVTDVTASWSHTFTNHADQGFFRASVLTP